MPNSSLIREGRWLILRFPAPHEVLSWALVGGGRRRARAVAWYQVGRGELRPPLDPKKFLEERLQEASLLHAVGLLTSRDLDAHVDLEAAEKGLRVRCLATVGLSNALRVGDPIGEKKEGFGTINLLCQVSLPLTEEAFLETLSIAAEARTVAILEAQVPSAKTGDWATGSGTDCIVVAAPSLGDPESYAGKHTRLGHLVGKTVFEATLQGAQCWRQEREGVRPLLPFNR